MILKSSDQDNPVSLLIIGTNKTGKTWDCLKIAKASYKCAFFTEELPATKTDIKYWYKGIRVFNPGSTLKENEKLVGEISNNYTNLTIIVDDTRLWIGGLNRLAFTISRMYARRRRARQILVLTCHSLSQVPSEILDYEPIIRIKPTSNVAGDRITLPKYFYEVANKVNAMKGNRWRSLHIDLRV